MRTGLNTVGFYKNLSPLLSRKACSSSTPIIYSTDSAGGPVISIFKSSCPPCLYVSFKNTVIPGSSSFRQFRRSTPYNVLPFPASRPLTKVPVSSIISAIERMWRNWQTRRFQVPMGLNPWRFDSSHPQLKLADIGGLSAHIAKSIQKAFFPTEGCYKRLVRLKDGGKFIELFRDYQSKGNYQISVCCGRAILRSWGNKADKSGRRRNY